MVNTQLMDLPYELLHKVLYECEPADIKSLWETCRALNQLLKNNRQLYKEMYLKQLDSPRIEPDWEAELKKFALFKSIVDCDDDEKKTANLPFIAERISHYLSTSTPNDETSRTISLLSEISENPRNRESFFCNSSLFQRVRSNAHYNGCPSLNDDFKVPTYVLNEEQRQASAKLHSLYGIPLSTTLQTSSSRPLTRSTRTYPYAVSKVYDLRNYTDGTFWGPFMDDGQATVDWEKMEAILVVLGHNVREFAEKTSGSMNALCESIWKDPWKDAVGGSCTAVYEPRLEEPGLSLDARDPYGITGTYLRVVCFLDFTELYTYNFVGPDPPSNNIPRPPLDTIEATRLILMDLRVTKFEAPGEDDGQDYPVVHFRGTSRSVDSSYDANANSNIRGTVRQTKEGEIRWTTYSIYHGEERWKSESIQVGGIRSARGAIGSWFDKDFDIHGPAGPTAFWKVSEDVLEQMLLDDDMEDDGDLDDGDYSGGEEDDGDGEGEDEVVEEDVVMVVGEDGMGRIFSFVLGQGENLGAGQSGNDGGDAEGEGERDGDGDAT